ncbi:MAG: ATP-binding protein [bacterium]
MALIKNILIQPRSLILIFIVTAVIVISSVVIELSQSKNEMVELMEKQSHTLLETVLASSKNALLSYDRIETQLKERLLIVAVSVRELYNSGSCTVNRLKDIANRNRVSRINIFRNDGEKVLSSIVEIHTGLEEKSNPLDFLRPIFEENLDTLFIGIKPARHEEGYRFAVAVKAKNGNAVVVNVDADELIRFRKEVGFGVLLKKVTENKQIEYAVLQNEDGILAASGLLDNLEPIDNSRFLSDALNKNQYRWRIIDTDSMNVFEAVHPFIYEGEALGIFRLGLSLEPLKNINDRLTRRIIYLGILFLVFGFITLTLIFVRQNFDVLSRKIKVVENYSRRIIENTGDGIIVLDSANKIKSMNDSAKQLLGIENEDATGSDFLSLLSGENRDTILNLEKELEEFVCTINGKRKIFLLSKSNFVDEKNETNLIIIIRDLTEIKILGEQIHRSEKLKAMGELASSVAHEIRNPLNSIGTITQQLGKDFTPRENHEDFKNLTGLVYKEVRRINTIIEDFLKFSKPQPIKPEKFLLCDLFNQISKQYQQVVAARAIQLKINCNYPGEVIWDFSQMKQVFINLIENALNTVDDNGSINIVILEKFPQIEIALDDNGKGIAPENLKKIFDLYFTTKVSGSGIGLSIVQKIINEHNGSISVESIVNRGTKFLIHLPVDISNGNKNN